jgi:cytochrome P450
VGIDWASQSFKQNPFPSLAQLRAAGPVVRVRFPLFGKVWIATTYEAVNVLLRDHERFVQNPTAAGNRWMARILRWLPRSLQPIGTNMLLRDPPDHRRLRSLVDQAFQRNTIEALRPRVEALASEALDHLEAEHARSRGGVDLLTHFALPFPLAVICELLGLPPEDRANFTRWAANFSTASSLPGIIWGLFFGVRRMMQYSREEFRRQRDKPRNGLMAALIEAEEAGDRLSEDELVAMVFLLLAAGHETTLHQIACSTLALFDHPETLGELQADWSLAEPAADELLRFVSFAQVSKPRYARADMEFYGQSIRRGEMVFACLASANADPAEFEHPERLDLQRPANRHVAFGTGIHVCLGAKLARMEIALALQKLFTRFPDLRLAIPREQVRYSSRFGTRSLMSLPVTW